MTALIEKNPLIVTVVGRGLFCIGSSVVALTGAAHSLRRPLLWDQGSSSEGIALNLWSQIQKTAEILGVRTWRGILMTEDIYIPQSEAQNLANAIYLADKNKINFVVPFKLVTGLWNVDAGLTDEQYGKMESWTKIKTCGLAFYYGPVYADYEWWEGVKKGIRYGDDNNYIRENKLEIYAVKLRMGHVKEMILGLEEDKTGKK